MEEIGDLTLLHRSPVDQVLVFPADDHLPSDGHLVERFVTHGATRGNRGMATAKGGVGNSGDRAQYAPCSHALCIMRSVTGGRAYDNYPTTGVVFH